MSQRVRTRQSAAEAGSGTSTQSAVGGTKRRQRRMFPQRRLWRVTKTAAGRRLAQKGTRCKGMQSSSSLLCSLTGSGIHAMFGSASRRAEIARTHPTNESEQLSGVLWGACCFLAVRRTAVARSPSPGEGHIPIHRGQKAGAIPGSSQPDATSNISTRCMQKTSRR
jgi:hypothetical protein